jgi:probable HAF family extracellular repeat protein
VPGASATYASGINAAGDICGWFLDFSGQLHGFVLHNGTFQTIDYPNSLGTNANGLNDNNAVVGGYVPSNLHNQGFLLSGTSLRA